MYKPAYSKPPGPWLAQHPGTINSYCLLRACLPTARYLINTSANGALNPSPVLGGRRYYHILQTRSTETLKDEITSDHPARKRLNEGSGRQSQELLSIRKGAGGGKAQLCR